MESHLSERFIDDHHDHYEEEDEEEGFVVIGGIQTNRHPSTNNHRNKHQKPKDSSSSRLEQLRRYRQQLSGDSAPSTFCRPKPSIHGSRSEEEEEDSDEEVDLSSFRTIPSLFSIHRFLLLGRWNLSPHEAAFTLESRTTDWVNLSIRTS